MSARQSRLRSILYGMRFCLIIVSTALVPHRAQADQEVTLQSGTTLVGEVQLYENLVVMSINGAEIQLPLNQVRTIKPTGSKTQAGKDSRELLLVALEARLLKNEKISSELMAYAYKLQPNDPHIAFWFTRSLVESGEGSAADRIFRKHDQAIAASYPLWASKLQEEIEHRVTVESYPRGLVERLDKLASEQVPSTSNRKERIMKHLVFSLCDQNGAAINQSSFRIQSGQSDESLEAFGKGLYLFTYRQYPHSHNVCQIDITHEDLVIKQFELPGTTLQEPPILHELIAHRYDDSEKFDFKTRISDQHGKPIAGATVRLQQKSKSSRSSRHLTTTANSDGIANLRVFPRKYSYSATARNYIGSRGVLDMSEHQKAEKPFGIVMKKALKAKLHIEWKTKGYGASAVTTSGEHVLNVVGSASNNNRMELAQLIRPMQVKDKLYLVFSSHPMQRYQARDTPVAEPAWLRAVPIEAGAEMKASVRKALFDAIDLNNLAGIKEKYPVAQSETSSLHLQPHATAVAIRDGSIYVGQFQQRENRTGRPVLVICKVRVEMP